MKIKKLDARMNGYGFFKYGIDFNKKWSHTEFHNVRLWCWETFGPSCELDLWHELDFKPDVERNPRWAWDRSMYNKTNRCMLYLKDDQEANWFTLRWGV
jgi:hypothetical protein